LILLDGFRFRAACGKTGHAVPPADTVESLPCCSPLKN